MLADAWGRVMQLLEYVHVVHLVSPRPDALSLPGATEIFQLLLGLVVGKR